MLFCLQTADPAPVRRAVSFLGQFLGGTYTKPWGLRALFLRWRGTCFVVQWVACSIFFSLLTFYSFFPDEPPQPSSSHNDSVPSYCKNDEGDIFLAAESWKPDVCTSCVCLDSVISCFSESCPSVSCERPVLRKGQCCPYCIGKTKKKSPSSLPLPRNLC